MGSAARLTRVIIVVVSLFLLVTGLILNAIGGLNPSWQVVDIREFQAEHHHGLWLDCTRADRAFLSPNRLVDKSPLHCTYKFDQNAAQVLDESQMDADAHSSAAEAEHHHFYGWHKAVLLFIILSFGAGCLSVMVGFCSPCAPAYAMIYAFLNFTTWFTGACAVGIFFFAAHRVDSRFVQGLVATYEQTIGSAFYFYSAGVILHFFVFVLSVIIAYQSLRRDDEDDELPIRELAPLYRHQVYGKTAV
ncbi:unnamed protein product [Bursaphelenchus okinawaensis]|uniref:Clc-like protein n=1 Tax=Bursaphelenchus okinawaensis TaxID=465554 RepID=A0A811L884_9BILA|nr:unnamed protein product [Bursaphelenchus okinawaensis]CAG9118071.1 unnamed protein product [Bursaphelenchus okinawaensis]